MKTRFGRLAIAAMLLSGSSMVVANDGTSVVGDLPGYGEDAYFGEDAAYTKVAASNEADEDESADADQNFAGDYVDENNFDNEASANEVQPVAHQQQAIQHADGRSVMRHASAHHGNGHPGQMQPVSHEMMGSGYVNGGYSSGGHSDCGCGESSCGGGTSCGAEMDCGCGSTGCDGGSSCQMSNQMSKRMGKLFDRLHGNTWAQVDTMLWFTGGRSTPSLITTSDPTTDAALPETPADIINNPNNVQTVFGGDIQTDLSVGIRTDTGIWLTDRIGVGGRFWALTDSEQSFNFSGNGDGGTIGRSFFDTNGFFGVGTEASLPVAVSGPVDPNQVGDIFAESSLQLYSAETYARLRMSNTKQCQLDFIGGYSYFNIKDNLTIDSTTTATTAFGTVGVGDQARYLDRFRTENEFNGGQLGFDIHMNKGRWMAQSLTKVHLGNMNQTLAANGLTTITPNGAVGTTTSGGVLTGSTPITEGDTTRDIFAFAPEVNFKLGYRFRPNVSLSVGYSFIYFDNVALTGEAIDRNVDATLLQTNGNNNGFRVDDSSFFVQGVDLGFVIGF